MEEMGDDEVMLIMSQKVVMPSSLDEGKGCRRCGLRPCTCIKRLSPRGGHDFKAVEGGRVCGRCEYFIPIGATPLVVGDCPWVNGKRRSGARGVKRNYLEGLDLGDLGL